MTEYKLIDWRLYDPRKSLFGSKKDKAKFRTLKCSMSHSCDAYASGQCAVWSGLGTRCPYGKITVEVGFTQRAMKFGSWIRERERKVKDLAQLNERRSLARVGEFVFFPYSHWSIDFPGIAPEFRSSLFSSGTKFIPVEVFTIDFFEKVVNHRPRSMFGSFITKYQDEIVPKMVMHLEEVMPGFFDEWSSKYPETARRFRESKSYVGRKAYLTTIKAGSVLPYKSGEMRWDGDALEITGFDSVFLPVRKLESVVIKAIPTDGAIVEITDDAQVTSETRFVD